VSDTISYPITPRQEIERCAERFNQRNTGLDVRPLETSTEELTRVELYQASQLVNELLGAQSPLAMSAFHIATRWPSDNPRVLLYAACDCMNAVKYSLIRAEIRNQEAARADIRPPLVPATPPPDPFVDPLRIEALRSIPRCGLDTARLVRILEEINIAHANDALFSVAALTRIVMNHIPTAFDQPSFVTLISQTSRKSFKGVLEHLEKSLRQIADGHAHEAMRDIETLPSRVQVDFRQSLDTLLSEAIQRLERKATAFAAAAAGR
jgi:hypothetical protein